MNAPIDATDLEELIARIVRKKFPALALLNVRTYVVRKVYTGADYGRCDLALESDPEQQLPRVDQWPGIAGGVCLPAVGSLVEVTWRDGAENSPVIVGFQASRLTNGKPEEVKIDAATIIEIGPSAPTVKLANGASYIALAPLVDDRLDKIATAIGQIAVVLNAAIGPVMSAPGTVAPLVLASVAATNVTAQ